MTRDSRSVPKDLARYKLAWAPRGTPIPPRAGRTPRGDVRMLRVQAPLVDFPWEGEGYPIGDRLRIVPAPNDFRWDVEGARYFLSEDERETARAAAHWIEIDQLGDDKTSAAAKINAFLIGLWIVRPTLTHVAIRFENGPDGVSVSRMLDRFQWIKDELHPDLREEHLARVRTLVPGLLRILGDRGRLNNALTLTFRGCVSIDWQSSFVCFAAALEGLLNYESHGGITQRLAANYCNLVTRYDAGSAKDHSAFVNLYNVRSEIVHGRAYERESSVRNVEELAACSQVLRRVWRVVLEHEEVREALEGDDTDRARLLAAP